MNAGLQEVARLTETGKVATVTVRAPGAARRFGRGAVSTLGVEGTRLAGTSTRGRAEPATRKAQLMRGKGISYSTGSFHAEESTREPFDPELVKREMRIIHDDLHCNAVRVTGGNPDRLEIAAAFNTLADYYCR